MIDTKPVLTPQACRYCGSEDIRINSQWGRVGTFHCGCNDANCAMDGPMRHDEAEAIAAWNRLTVVKPAQEEKPKAEPATDEEIRNYQLLSSPLSPRQTVALFDRIEADREKLKTKDADLEWVRGCRDADAKREQSLQAQNAEQAQEIARLRVRHSERITEIQQLNRTIKYMRGMVFVERRKAERRGPYDATCEHTRRQVNSDRRKAK